MRTMTKWILGIVILGLLAGDSKDLDGFFQSLAPGAADSVQNVSSDWSNQDLNVAISNPTGNPSDCVRTEDSVLIYLNPQRFEPTIAHINTAVSAGAPRTLHLYRFQAQQRYQVSVSKADAPEGQAVDQWPIAASYESVQKVTIAYVPAREDQAAGDKIGSALAGYCNGQAFRIITHRQ